MVRWLYNLYESLPENVVVTFYMEANFMQDIILDEFATEGNIRGYQLPIMPDTRKKPEKIQRIEAVSPLWERGFVFYNEALKDSPDMEVGIEQTLALERGSRVHDDAPDADEGAIWFLQRCTRQETFKPVSIPRRSTLKTHGDMFKTIKKYYAAWRFKRAVRKAKKLAGLFGMKYYVINLGGSLKVVPKQTIKELIKRKRFRKGVTVEDIERHALFVTT